MNAMYGIALLTLGIFLFSFASPTTRLRLLFFRPYTFSSLSQHPPPDLVLVGNSLLSVNVDRVRLEQDLTRQLHRPIRVVFVSDWGTSCAWWYIAIKNAVVPYLKRATPIGVVEGGTSLTSYDLHYATRDLWQLNKIMAGPEEVFFRKTHHRYRAAADLSRYWPDRHDLNRFLLESWANGWLALWPTRANAKAFLDHRLTFGVEASAFSALALQHEKENYIPFKTCWDPEACADVTFLPDLLASSQGNPLVVIESHFRPDLENPADLHDYRARLKTYLEKRHVTFISLRERSELADARLYNDTTHFTSEGQRINTDLLAEELLRHHVLAAPSAWPHRAEGTL